MEFEILWSSIISIATLISAVAAVMVACAALKQSNQNKELIKHNQMQLEETIKNRRMAVQPRFVASEGNQVAVAYAPLREEDIDVYINYSGSEMYELDRLIVITNRGHGAANNLRITRFQDKEVSARDEVGIIEPGESRTLQLHISMEESDYRATYHLTLHFENMYREIYKQAISLRFMGPDELGLMRFIGLRALQERLIENEEGNNGVR